MTDCIIFWFLVFNYLFLVDYYFNFLIISSWIIKEKPKLKSRNSKKHEIDSAIQHKKKEPLRTAGDVRKRIQWDSDLLEEYFTVGYLDRFTGVEEKPFLLFKWEHLALVDIDDLAIPQHRIQYYKYKGTKVWDKNERLDHVFGSANNGITIHEAMKKIDDRLTNESSDCGNSDDDDDSDDDEGIIIENNDTDYVKIKSIDIVRSHEEERASHFLCIKVANENLKNRVRKVQDAVVNEELILNNCKMPSELLHVTLAMVKCKTHNSIIEITNFLEEIKPKLCEMLGDISNSDEIETQRVIKAQGLSTFGARVLYTKLDVPSSFFEVVEMIREKIENIEDACITNNFDFVPHMTLMKVNRFVARERKSKYINSCLYNDYLNELFGAIIFDNIHFCSIEDNRGLDGFYVTIKNIEF